MKKKFLFATIMTVMCMTLTACGNPLKMLPEANDDVNIYDSGEKTTGNAAADEIIKALKKGDAIEKKITEFYVEERNDKESKERSNLEICVVTETDDATFERHFDVTMKYDEDDKEWGVKEYKVDKDSTVVTPTSGVDNDTLQHDICYRADAPSFGDNRIYLSEDKYTYEIKSDKIGYDKKIDMANDTVELEVTVDNGMVIYKRTLNMVYDYSNYGYGEDYKWVFEKGEWAEDYESEYSETFNAFFTPENMMSCIGNRNVYMLNDYFSLNADMFDSYSFDEFEVERSNVKAPGTAHFKNNQFLDVNMDFRMSFYTYSEPYEFSSFDGTPTLTVDYSKLVGTGTAKVTDKYDNTKELGDITITFDSASDSNITGTLKYEPNSGSAKEVSFTGAEYASWGDQIPGMISLTLDSDIEWQKYSKTDTIYLSYDLETGNLLSSKTYGAYFELTR